MFKFKDELMDQQVAGKNPLRRMIFCANLIFLLFFCLLLNGCGYVFQGSGSILPDDVRRIYIPFVDNDSAESGLSLVMTESLQDQFGKFGVITVVDSIDDADAILRVHIKNVNRSTRSVTSVTDVSLQQDTSILMSGDLRRVNGLILWQNPNLSVSRSFGTSQEAVVTTSIDFASSSIGASDLAQLDTLQLARGQEEEALAVLAEEAARQIYEQAVLPEF